MLFKKSYNTHAYDSLEANDLRTNLLKLWISYKKIIDLVTHRLGNLKNYHAINLALIELIHNINREIGYL